MPPRELVISEHDLELGYVQGWFQLARIEANRPVYVMENTSAPFIEDGELEALGGNSMGWSTFFRGANLNGGDEFRATADLASTQEGPPISAQVPQRILRVLLNENWVAPGAVDTLYHPTQRIFYEFEGTPYVFRVGDTIRLETDGPHPAIAHVRHQHYQWLSHNALIRTSGDTDGNALTVAMINFVTRNAAERWLTVSEASVILLAVEDRASFGVLGTVMSDDTSDCLQEFLDLANNWDLSSEQMELIEAVLSTPDLVRVVEPESATPKEPVIVGPSTWERLLDEPLV